MSASCAPPKPLTPPQVAATAATISDAAGGGGHCSTEQDSGTFSAEIDAMIIAGKMSASVNHTSTFGCEQLVILANSYNNQVSNVNCIIQKNTASISKSVDAVNNITLNNDSVEIDGDFSINQSIKVKLVDISQITQGQKNEMAAAAKAVSTQVVETAQKSSTGLGATPQGQKTLQDVRTNLESYNFNNNITETLSTFSATTDASNTVFINTKNLKVHKNFTINQDVVLDILSNSIVQNAVTSSLSALSDAVTKSEASAKQGSDATGVEDLGKVIKAGSLGSSSYVRYIIIFVVIMSLLFIGYEIYVDMDKKKGSKNNVGYKQRSY